MLMMEKESGFGAVVEANFAGNFYVINDLEIL